MRVVEIFMTFNAGFTKWNNIS